MMKYNFCVIIYIKAESHNYLKKSDDHKTL